MPDLENRIRHYYEQAAAPVTAEEAIERHQRRPDIAASLRGPALAAAVAMAVVAGGLAAFLLVRPLGPAPTEDPGPAGPTEGPAVAGPETVLEGTHEGHPWELGWRGDPAYRQWGPCARLVLSEETARQTIDACPTEEVEVVFAVWYERTVLGEVVVGYLAPGQEGVGTSAPGPLFLTEPVEALDGRRLFVQFVEGHEAEQIEVRVPPDVGPPTLVLSPEARDTSAEDEPDAEGATPRPPPRVDWERSVEGGEYSAVVAAGSGFVAVERFRGVVVSEDGQRWQAVPNQPASTSQGQLQFSALATDGSRIVLVGSEGQEEGPITAVWVSDDAERWERVDAPGTLRAVSWTGERFVAIGYADSGAGGRVVAAWVSTDGERWERAPHDPEAFESDQELQVASVAAGPAGVVAVGMEGTDGAVWHSPDGREWERVSEDLGIFGGEGYQVVHDVLPTEQGFLVVGGSDESGAMAWRSADGRTWEPIDGLGPGGIRAITKVPGGMVGVGVENRSGVLRAAAWSSTDGIRWKRVPHDESIFGGEGNTVMYDVAAADDRVVAVGFRGIWVGQIR